MGSGVGVGTGVGVGVGRRLGEGRRLITAGREEAEGKGYAVDAVVHSRRVSKGSERKKGEAATGVVLPRLYL